MIVRDDRYEVLPPSIGRAGHAPVYRERPEFPYESLREFNGDVVSGMVPVLEHLYYNHWGAFSVEMLDSVANPHGFSGSQVLKACPGWFHETYMPGIWELGVLGSNRTAGGLAPYLLRYPDAPIFLAGVTVPDLCGWTCRSYETRIGLPPGWAVPEVCKGMIVHRWVPKAHPWDIRSNPAWSADTLIVYMAARADEYCWEDIADYLLDVCGAATEEGLRAELAELDRSDWMRTCVMLQYGERDDLANVLHESAPEGKGPYKLGTERGPFRFWPPERHEKFEVIDLVFPNWWDPRSERGW